MAKDTYYFSHDFNARNDRKIASLVKDFKSSGYGIYWCAAEMMHEEGGALDFDEITINAISKDLNEANEVVLQVLQKCIDVYKLFILHEKQIMSSRVKQNLSDREAKKDFRKEAGRKGGISSGKSRSNKKQMKQNEAELQNNEGSFDENEANEPKERKGNEIKVNEILFFNTLPSSLDFEKIEITEIQIGAVIQLMKISKQMDLSDGDVKQFWSVFKIQNFTGKKFYSDVGAIYSHFLNWMKTQNNKPILNGGTYTKSNENRKSFATGDAL